MRKAFYIFAIGFFVMFVAEPWTTYCVADINNGPVSYFSRIRDPQANVWKSYLGTTYNSKTLLNAHTICEPYFSRGLLGYPSSTGFRKGLCDTLTIKVMFTHRADTPYVWNGSDPSKWFVPRLHRTTADIIHDAPVVDTTELAYSVRCWMHRQWVIPTPTLFSKDSGNIVLLYDVTNIPEGVWVLSLGLTEDAPANLNFAYGGCVVECRQPKTAIDTVNAWLSLADRAIDLRDFDECYQWISKTIDHYPHSVPAWWMLGDYYVWERDSLAAVSAVDSALHFLDAKLDPLLPDTTGKVAFEERDYMRSLGYYLRAAQYNMPNRGWR